MNEDFFFQSDQIAPDDIDIKILDLRAEPYPDQRRVKVEFRLSGHQKSLGTKIMLTDQDKEEVASANIVNVFIPHQEITLHIPGPRAKPGIYELIVSLYSLQEVESEAEPGKVGEIRTNHLDRKSISLTIK